MSYSSHPIRVFNFQDHVILDRGLVLDLNQAVSRESTVQNLYMQYTVCSSVLTNKYMFWVFTVFNSSQETQTVPEHCGYTVLNVYLRHIFTFN